MARQTLLLKNDPYRESRGGYARFLNIYCAQCGKHVFLYQKDGPGPLKRTYLDRIQAPAKFIEFTSLELDKVPQLNCPSCQNVLGIPYLYDKEPRIAFLMKEGAFKKKLGRGIYPPLEY